MEENKPLETDSEEAVEETPEEESQQEESEGEKNVQEAVEEPKAFLTKEEVERLVGRKINDREDFVKHYKYLDSYVGKKIEAESPEVREEPSNNSAIMDKLTRIEFLGEHPEAKDYYDDLIKPLADGKNVSIEEAYKKVLPHIQATENQEKEKNIGVESKNRIEPAEAKDLEKLKKAAMSADPQVRKQAQDEYIRKNLLKKAGF